MNSNSEFFLRVEKKELPPLVFHNNIFDFILECDITWILVGTIKNVKMEISTSYCR